MKKLIGVFGFIVFLAMFTTPSCYAGASFRMEEHVVKPASKKEQVKAAKKLVKELRKEYRSEMKGMTPVQKKAFIEDKIAQSNLDIPNLKLLILGLILLLIGVIFYIIPLLGWVGYLLQSAGGIIILVWLILWLVELA
jgi:hypothetical protein